MHKRLDKQCEAEILAINERGILLAAYWPASGKDKLHFKTGIVNGTLLARNTLYVSPAYFERKYGTKPSIS